MKAQTRNTIARIALLVGLALGSPASAAETGLIGLYQLRDSASHAEALGQLAANLGERDCSIWRTGRVASARGPLDIPEADRFVLIRCGGSLLGDDPGRAALLPLEQAVENLAFAEGALTAFSDLSQPADPSRSYTIKISRYNDATPSQRDDDLAALNRDVSTRTGAFQNEAVVAVSRAMGFATPDDITVLYYRDSAEGKAFREQNGDIMKRIGAFNKAHLTDFVYLSASEVQ